MAEVIKTIEQIEDIFRLVILTILKLDPEAEENQSRIRFPWGSNLKNSKNGSVPAWKKDKDVCLIYSLPQEDFYNRNRDRKYIDPGGRDLIEVDEHTDVHFFNFVNYGPNAYECARNIRDGLFRDNIRRLLKKNKFFLLPNVSAIKRVPELFESEWWNRVDFSAIFNEYVRRESEMLTIEKVPLVAAGMSARGHMISREEIIERSESNNE